MNRRSRRIVLGTLLGVTIGVPLSLAEPSGRMQTRTYGTGTSLVVNGQTTCAILFPAEPPAWRAMAERLADGLRALGAVDVPLIPDTEAVPQRLGPIPDALAGKSLILLGNVKVNRAFFPLYANYYTYCDMDYPGGDGHVVRTVVRPFGQPVNYLLAGGSTVEGAGIAVERLLGRLGELEPGGDVELPYCLDVGLAPALSRVLDPIVAELSDDAGVPEEAPYGQARDAFTARAHLYYYTGHDALAHGARRWALALVQREPGPIRISDYHLVNLAAAWRRVSVSPAFSATDRRLIDERILQTAAEQETAWWRQRDASAGIGTRHQTTGMLGWWSLMRTLQELGEPDAAAAAYLAERRRECEAYLDGLLRHYSDDSDDYQSADSVHNTVSYALQTGQFEWFHSGLARRAAERILAITDNQGTYAGIMGYGEALPGWERFTLNAGLLLGACDYVYEDSSFRWLLMRFPPLHRTWGPLHPWRLGLF
ncbi:MAG: hypothetical protein JXA69_04105, partial [Phycisphaerae bacterium]|nr:hypothetical protein [Phycisphaerae bacterium]